MLCGLMHRFKISKISKLTPDLYMLSYFACFLTFCWTKFFADRIDFLVLLNYVSHESLYTYIHHCYHSRPINSCALVGKCTRSRIWPVNISKTENKWEIKLFKWWVPSSEATCLHNWMRYHSLWTVVHWHP